MLKCLARFDICETEDQRRTAVSSKIYGLQAFLLDSRDCQPTTSDERSTREGCQINLFLKFCCEELYNLSREALPRHPCLRGSSALAICDVQSLTKSAARFMAQWRNLNMCRARQIHPPRSPHSRNMLKFLFKNSHCLLAKD